MSKETKATQAKAAEAAAADVAAETAAAETAAAEKRAVETVQARVLQDCAYGATNAVADVPADELESAKAAGLVDDHPSAVEYALSLAD